MFEVENPYFLHALPLLEKTYISKRGSDQRADQCSAEQRVKTTATIPLLLDFTISPKFLQWKNMLEIKENNPRDCC